MRRESLNDLSAFAEVAGEASFTHAAARLGVSPSALSHTIRGLEERLGLRLLSRTTRSVTPTEAGERLLRTLRPALDDIDSELASLVELRERPSGTIRITTSENAAETILWPALTRLLPDYPDIKVELAVEPALTDIVAERFDAGVRLGEQVARDMVAVRVGPDLSMAVVGAPAYFAVGAAEDASRSGQPRVRQPSSGERRRPLCLGVREAGKSAQRARRWPLRLQQRFADPARRRGRVRTGLRARRPRRRPDPGWAPRARAPRLVPALRRLPPLLPQPPPAIAGVRAAGGSVALPRLRVASPAR
jgi:DNA-binding transcriptional LysR family regulator